jgi:hypothetical protein
MLDTSIIQFSPMRVLIYGRERDSRSYMLDLRVCLEWLQPREARQASIRSTPSWGIGMSLSDHEWPL